MAYGTKINQGLKTKNAKSENLLEKCNDAKYSLTSIVDSKEKTTNSH